ncbi:hypothetical protein ACWE42_18670 [Sutcliffiella cohnii]
MCQQHLLIDALGNFIDTAGKLFDALGELFDAAGKIIDALDDLFDAAIQNRYNPNRTDPRAKPTIPNSNG